MARANVPTTDPGRTWMARGADPRYDLDATGVLPGGVTVVPFVSRVWLAASRAVSRCSWTQRELRLRISTSRVGKQADRNDFVVKPNIARINTIRENGNSILVIHISVKLEIFTRSCSSDVYRRMREHPENIFTMQVVTQLLLGL